MTISILGKSAPCVVNTRPINPVANLPQKMFIKPGDFNGFERECNKIQLQDKFRAVA